MPSPGVLAIPMKDLVDAKQRLVNALGPEERQALAAAMLEDVLAAVSGARVDAVWIITRDAEVTTIARRHGAPGRSTDKYDCPLHTFTGGHVR